MSCGGCYIITLSAGQKGVIVCSDADSLGTLKFCCNVVANLSSKMKANSCALATGMLLNFDANI